MLTPLSRVDRRRLIAHGARLSRASVPGEDLSHARFCLKILAIVR